MPEGSTFDFHWTGNHNVLQVGTFKGQVAPLGPFADAKWPRQLKSGAKTTSGKFSWHTGTFPCGYRPGIYFFVDEDNPAGGVVSATITTPENKYIDPAKPAECTVLGDPRSPKFYGGRYASYAARPGCKLWEVDNFTTQAHFDWVPPTFAGQATQGDLVIFRWTGLHNVVQVHDVTQDLPMKGALTSGSKTNCVGGPHYLCANGPPSLGEFLIDTENYRPGVLHFSDEAAMTGTGSPTGMNQQFGLRLSEARRKRTPGTCTALDPSKPPTCAVVDLYNDGDGMQFAYNVPVGKGDLIRFRWAGSLKLFQAVPAGNGAPTKTPKAGGVGTGASVDCTPGPNMSCLEGNDAQAQLVVDVAKEIARGNVETGPGGQYFAFMGLGDNRPGFSSQDTGTTVYVDAALP